MEKTIEAFQLRRGRPKHVYTNPLTLDDYTASVSSVAAKISEYAFNFHTVAIVHVKKTSPDVEETRGRCALYTALNICNITWIVL